MNGFLKRIMVLQAMKRQVRLLPRYFHAVLVLAALLMALTLMGCKSGHGLTSPDAAKRLDQLYRAYLGGDMEQARQSMVESISILETHHFPKPSASAHGLWLAYARLFVLESAAGNDALADACLMKARYWLLRRAEISGDTEENAVEAADGFTADKCMEVIHKWDNNFTGGKGPRYLRQYNPVDTTR